MDYARNFTSFVVHCNVPIVLISVAVIECLLSDNCASYARKERY